MKKIFPLIILLNLFVLSCKTTQNSTSSKKEITNEQQQIITELTKDFPVGTACSIALIENGQVQYYGVENTEQGQVPIHNQKAVFEIGSISKVFTATLLAEAVLEKKVTLDDPINNSLKFKLKDDLQIKFKDLANHTAGLPRLPGDLMMMALMQPKNPYQGYTHEKLESYLSEYLILTKPGEYAYSNLGAGLLGFTLAKMENTSYLELLKNKIALKYKMLNTTTDRKKVERHLVKGRDKDGQITSNWDFGVLDGAGAILSNTMDLSNFVLAQFNDENLALALTRKMTVKVGDKMDIGLGWHIVKKDDRRIYWHNGGTGGYSSSMTMDVAGRSAVVLLTNLSSANPNTNNVDQLCFSLLKSLPTNP